MLTQTRRIDDTSSEIHAEVSRRPMMTEERRASGRVYARLAARLSAPCGSEAVACDAVDIGEGGICVEVPISSGMMLGQRFEVVVQDDAGTDELVDLFVDGVYATVVRTTIQSGAEGPCILAGLRFDQPLIFDGFARVGSA